jgi:TetR/AcrR family transcriptional repressor of nem operon
MRYGADHKEKTRERVLAETAKAIRQEGPHGISVGGVMARAGLTHGAFYAHFGSRDALLAAGVDRMFQEGRARLTGEVEAGRTSAEALRRYINFYLSRDHRDADGWGCPVPVLSAEAPRLTDAVRERFARGVADLTGVIAGLLTALGVEHPKENAASLLSEMVGALSLARAEPDRARSDAILKASRLSLRRRFGVEPSS